MYPLLQPRNKPGTVGVEQTAKTWGAGDYQNLMSSFLCHIFSSRRIASFALYVACKVMLWFTVCVKQKKKKRTSSQLIGQFYKVRLVLKG